ncbi:MAG TPA: MMPL family transporter, partial [Candidatus Limnocylindria bacterium]|nr:MMPL family transporter [Candidatus Limnocylindria bacterium]
MATTTPPRTTPGGHVLEPHPTGMFAALGRFDYRFRRVLPVIGLALVIGLNAWAAVGGGELIQGGWVIPGSQEQQAADQLAKRFGQDQTTMLVVYTDPAGDAASTAFQRTVRQSLVDVAADDSVIKVVTYADTHRPEQLSTDGASTLAVVNLNKPVEAAVDDSARLADEIRRPPGVTVQVTGVAQLYHEFNQKVEQDLLTAETISIPIALIILLAVFGTLAAAGLPILVAGLALPTALAAVGLLAGVMDMSIYATNILSMIGLALSIDYSLFMVSRYREELRHHDPEIAL